MVECSNCKKVFRRNERGCKLVPKPICHDCVILTIPRTCQKCGEVGCMKEKFYLATCWACQLEGCKRCIPNVKFANGIEFDFCDRCKGYDMKRLVEDANDIIEEESLLSDKEEKVKQDE